MSHQHTPDISLQPEVNREMDKEHARVDYYAVLSLVKIVGDPEISNNHSFCPGRAWMAEKPWMEIVFVSLTINLV